MVVGSLANAIAHWNILLENPLNDEKEKRADAEKDQQCEYECRHGPISLTINQVMRDNFCRPAKPVSSRAVVSDNGLFVNPQRSPMRLDIWESNQLAATFPVSGLPLATAASPDGNAYALRKSDGSTVWASRVADPTAAGHGEFIQSSPSVSTALGRLYLGVGSTGDHSGFPGRVVSFEPSGSGLRREAVGLRLGQRGYVSQR